MNNLGLAFLLTACVHKPPTTILPPPEPVYTKAQMEVYLDLQGRCEDLLAMFESGEFRMSEEPYVERKDLILEASQLDLWDYIPQRLDYCLSAIQKY